MITDYKTLQDAIAAWLARADLTAQIPTFIQLAEQRFARDIRVRSMQNTVQGTVADSQIQLPSDCREIQSLRVTVDGDMFEVRPLPPERLSDSWSSLAGYVLINNIVHLVGNQGTPSYALTYWQELPDLASAPMNRNWLIQREPGLYLYAALIEASPYIGDDARTEVWVAQYRDIVTRMHAEDASARYGNAPAQVIVGMP